MPPRTFSSHSGNQQRSEEQPHASASEHDPRLQKTLKTRHLRMIALGGVIGAGLFVGSSAIITKAGPGAFIT